MQKAEPNEEGRGKSNAAKYKRFEACILIPNHLLQWRKPKDERWGG